MKNFLLNKRILKLFYGTTSALGLLLTRFKLILFQPALQTDSIMAKLRSTNFFFTGTTFFFISYTFKNNHPDSFSKSDQNPNWGLLRTLSIRISS